MLARVLRDPVRSHLTPLLLLVLLQLVQSVATLYLPTLNADIIDNGVLKGDTNYILQIGGWMLAVTVLQVACAAGATYFAAFTSMGVGHHIRAAVFSRVQRFSAREMGRLGTSSLIMRTTNDVQQVQMVALLALTVMVSAPMMGIGSIVMALGQDVPLSGLLLALVPVLGILIALLMRRMQPLQRAVQQRMDKINRVMREQISGVRVIRAFVKDRHEQQRFGQANEDLLDASMRTGRLMALMVPVVMLTVNVCSVGVVWFGAQRIDSGGMQIGALTAFLSYLVQMLTSVVLATSMFMLVPRATVCAERIQEVLTTEPSIAPPAAPRRETHRGGRVELRQAGFFYPGAEAPVLQDVDLVAEPGETVAVIGSTGSGKSTLLGMVPRLFDVTSGQVLVNGVDVREMEPGTLTSRIGLVPQAAYLFTGTVASNLRYGRAEATDAELWAALEVAQAKDFVERMDDGLQASVSRGGTNLSGGQRQRLAIARALVHRPEIFLFDDSFSALDYATDAALREALAWHIPQATVINVAQRVSTVREADRIVVLDQGRVVGSGTHSELAAANATYQEILASQRTEEEAA
ncbi:ABC transporter ATP-binding protein [Streptomyces diacarni]|uniref:ABC transporter ATP-binding protein n=1 Tax=Streptomyces diacarni TaxID=2800381 RepID=UPI0033F55D08